MRFIIFILLLFFPAIAAYAQLSQEDVKDILIIQGYNPDNINEEATELHKKYLDKICFKQEDFLNGIADAALSGISMGAQQSRTANYTHSNWLPGFIEQWWTIKPRTDQTFGKVLSWQKFFRETDYIFNFSSYESLNRFYGGNWIFSLITSTFIKELSASLIRHKFKYGRFF